MIAYETLAAQCERSQIGTPGDARRIDDGVESISSQHDHAVEIELRIIDVLVGKSVQKAYPATDSDSAASRSGLGQAGEFSDLIRGVRTGLLYSAIDLGGGEHTLRYAIR